MPLSKKIFRVFVSSTFSDMKAERAILQEKVFRGLKEHCRWHGAVFQDIDLRWGVTEEATKTHQTMKICLNEIARCQRISPKPNFIVLLGGRYGWQPLPAEIPSEEAGLMMKVMSSGEIQLFHAWYKEDTNACPSLHILQQRPERDQEWSEVENALNNLLRQAADRARLNPSQRKKYFCSATHQEIISGALNPPPGMYDPKEHVFCYFRDMPNLPNRAQPEDYLDLDRQGNPDAYCRDQMGSLKKDLEKWLPAEHIYAYPGGQHGDIAGPENPDEFAERIYRDLKEIIDRQLEEIKEEDALTQEITRHEAFAEQATADFTGREDVIGSISAYLAGNEQRVYALVGASGSGKTTIMAKAANDARKGTAAVIARFLGTTAGSSNIDGLFAGINEQVARAYETDINLLRGSNEKRKQEKDVFKECLMLGIKERPLVIFIDALDQLPSHGRAYLMDALPDILPVYCKIVISGTEAVEPLFGRTAKQSLHPMNQSEGEALLTAWLQKANRTLREDQKREVMERFSRNGLPLYLRLLFESARGWHSYDPGIPDIAEDIEGVLKEYFHALEKQHTEELISTVMGYLLCSRHGGLPENEVLELLAEDEEYWESFLKKYPYHSEEAARLKRVPVALWSRLYLDLAPYLTERMEDGASLLVFYHRQFGQYAQNAYIKGKEERYYRNLGEYGEDVIRAYRKTASPLSYTALYSLVYYLRAGIDEKVREINTWTFMATEGEGVDTGIVERLATYVIEEGNEEEKGRYKGIIENCRQDMPENEAWGGFLGKTGRGYHQTVFQQWAIFYYKKSISIVEAIQAQDPGNIVIANALAATYGNLGSLLHQSNCPAEAVGYYRKAIDIVETIHAQDPGNVDIANGLAKTWGSLGFLLHQSNRSAEAEEYYRKAIGIGERIHAQYPGFTDIWYSEKPDYKDMERIHVQDPGNIDIAKNALAATYGNLGSLLRQSNRSDEAVGYFRKAIDIREAIYAKYPGNIDIANGLAANYENLGLLLHQSNRSDEAEGYYRKAIGMGERIHAKYPGNIDIANGLVTTYANLGLLLHQSNRPPEAMGYYRKAIDMGEAIHEQNPGNIDIANGLAATCGNLGSLLHQSNRPDEAVGHYRKAIDIREAICGKNPDNTDITYGLATDYEYLGFLLYSKGDYAGAEQPFQRALKIKEKIFGADHPNTLTTLTNLAWCLRNKGNHRDAIPLYSRILQIYENLIGQGVAIPPDHLSVMAICHNEIAFHRDVPSKSWKEAEAHYRKAVELFGKVPQPVEAANVELNLQTMYHLSGQRVDMARVRELTRILEEAGDRRAEKGRRLRQ